MKYSKEEIIRYRIERAFESIEEAKILSQFQHWNTVVNRLYYACFYIVQALLIMNDAKVSTHSGNNTPMLYAITADDLCKSSFTSLQDK